jgi:hypothetical protein
MKDVTTLETNGSADFEASAAEPTDVYDEKILKSAFKKFDMFVFPVSIIFLVLSSLDRNNVSDIPDLCSEVTSLT